MDDKITKKFTKKHCNIYVITDAEYKCDATSWTLARAGIKAHTYMGSMANLNGNTDWIMQKSIRKGIILGCDMAFVVGDVINDEMLEQIKEVSSINKEICVSTPLQDAAKKLNIRFSEQPERISVLCKSLLSIE